MKLVKYLTAVVAAGMVLTGCESAQEALMSPSADYVTSGNAASTKVEKTRTTKRYQRVDVLITSLGGYASVGGHTLKVPANAVTQPTWFSMQVLEANAYQVKFRARRALDGATVTQFPVALEMTFDVSDLENGDPTGLTVVYLQDGTLTGGTEKVASKVNGTNSTVTGYLTHFSTYAIAREYSMGVD
jgi:hypothetical protein